MIKRASLVALCGFIVIMFSGCWNYRGLNTLDIVAGLAIDKDEERGLYLLTFELLDTKKSGSDEEISTKYVESEGKTIFEAVRSAKKRLINRLYGGNLQTLIISKQIAQTEGMAGVIEELLRDGESRETLSIIISEEKTAKEILLTEGLDSKIISYEVHDMVEEDSKLTASTKNMPLYKAYDAVNGIGASLVLPVIRCVLNNEEIVAECNGIALFKGDKLIGFESPQNAMYYLFLVDEVEGGALSIPINELDDHFSLEIKNSRSEIKVSEESGQFYVTAKIHVALHVTETKSLLNISQMDERKEMEILTENFLKEKIEQYFHKMQTDIGCDIFGLGRKIYRANPSLWRSVQSDWDVYFQNSELAVQVQADILTAGVMKNY